MSRQHSRTDKNHLRINWTLTQARRTPNSIIGSKAETFVVISARTLQKS